MPTVTVSPPLLALGQAARQASRQLSRTSTTVRDQALGNIAEALEAQQAAVLEANARDMEEGRRTGLSDSLLDRLLLDPDRLCGVAEGVRDIQGLSDPIGEQFDVRTLPNGLTAGRRRVPLGVIGAIYESRPNVTVDIAALCLKSGNACILRGGKEALHSNTALITLIQGAVQAAGIPGEAVQFINNTDRALVDQLLRMREYIDLLIPRGGADLVRFVGENATMPAITGGIGVCHTYVDCGADREKASRIVFNAKVRRPSICNALDTLLIHTAEAPRILPALAKQLAAAGVEMRCDARAMSLLAPLEEVHLTPATGADWGKEFLDLVMSVKVVDSLDEALEHIEQYGSGHSEAIVTQDYTNAQRFLDTVDAAAVYVNASTQFTDGGQFGLGAEVAISTSKFHARGPMGLRELTSYKWVVMGDGQIRD